MAEAITFEQSVDFPGNSDSEALQFLKDQLSHFYFAESGLHHREDITDCPTWLAGNFRLVEHGEPEDLWKIFLRFQSNRHPKYFCVPWSAISRFTIAEYFERAGLAVNKAAEKQILLKKFLAFSKTLQILTMNEEQNEAIIS